MRLIKLFFSFITNIYSLILVLGLLFVLFSGQAQWFRILDDQLFRLTTVFMKVPEVEKDVIMVTLPEAVPACLERPDTGPALIGFLDRLNKSHPAAVVLSKANVSSATNEESLLRLEARINEIALQAGFDDKPEIKELQEMVRGLSFPVKNRSNVFSRKELLFACPHPNFHSKSACPLMSNSILSLGCIAALELKYQEPGGREFLKRLYEISSMHLMPALEQGPAISAAGHNASCIVPAFFPETGSAVRPLVWQVGDRYWPDLATLLYARLTGSESITWIGGKGIRIGHNVVNTGIDGQVRPLFSSATGIAPELSRFSLQELSLHDSPSAFKDKVVLIGTKDDPVLHEALLTVISLKSGAVFYTSIWELLIGKSVIGLVFLYLVFVLPRVRGSLGGVLSVFLVFVCLTIQLIVIITLDRWLPLTAPMLFVLFGHSVMVMRLKTENHFFRLEADVDKANRMLGTYQLERNEYDNAFKTLSKCNPTTEILEMLYKVGDFFEGHRKYNKAYDVFNYVNHSREDFKDSALRTQRLATFQEGGQSRANGLSLTTDSLVDPASDLKRPVLGRYEIERVLGKGAMGIVYLGKDPQIGRLVAIKTMSFPESFGSDLERVKKRFYREAESAGRLDHQNIITIYDMGEEETLAYIAMEYVPGKPLSEFTKEGDLLPIPVVFELIRQVAEALDYAHGLNVVHRDIKPGNLLYNEDKHLIKVTDFGIARIIDSTQTRTGTILGTPFYMAPEQLKGSRVDGRADIFSLGVTLFQLLTGRLPFAGEDIASLVYQITNTKQPSVRDLRPELPAAATRIINKALQKSPAKRYPSAKNMAESLAAALKQNFS